MTYSCCHCFMTKLDPKLVCDGDADLLDEQGVLQEVLRTNEALRSLLHQKAEAATPEVGLLHTHGQLCQFTLRLES